MENANFSLTPVDPSNKLVKATEADNPFDQHIYQSAIGSLLYLSVATRPDILYAVSNVAKYSANPTIYSSLDRSEEDPEIPERHNKSWAYLQTPGELRLCGIF